MGKGKYGVSSRLVTRKALKPAPRPLGQCAGCYAARLPMALSLTVCQACKPANAAYQADRVVTARRHARDDVA